MFNILINVNLYDIQIFIIAKIENFKFMIRQISHGKIRDLISFYLDENLKTQVIDFWRQGLNFMIYAIATCFTTSNRRRNEFRLIRQRQQQALCYFSFNNSHEWGSCQASFECYVYAATVLHMRLLGNIIHSINCLFSKFVHAFFEKYVCIFLGIWAYLKVMLWLSQIKSKQIKTHFKRFKG